LQFHEMFFSPLGDSIWKIGHTVFHKGTILNFDEAKGPMSIVQENVDSRVCPVPLFHLEMNIPMKLGDSIMENRAFDEVIGTLRMDPHQRLGELNHFKREGRFAARFHRAREEHGNPFDDEAPHASGIGTMGHHGVPIVQQDIHEKPFVPADKDALGKRGPLKSVGWHVHCHFRGRGEVGLATVEPAQGTQNRRS